MGLLEWHRSSSKNLLSAESGIWKQTSMSKTINPKNLKKDNICKNNTDEDDLAVLKHENKTEKKKYILLPSFWYYRPLMLLGDSI